MSGGRMFRFRGDFNACKTIYCKNFGVINSEDYAYGTRRLGYLAIDCAVCGSHPPWIDNQLVKKILKEKFNAQFMQKLTGCPACNNIFFVTNKTETKRHGYTSAGTQRKKCTRCGSVFTMQHYKNTDVLNTVLNSVLQVGKKSNPSTETGLSARLYYFYLNKLALLLSNFSRLKEQASISTQHLAMHTQGKLVGLDHQRGFYSFVTSEARSGYILLQSNNLTQLQLQKKDRYSLTDDTRIVTNEHKSTENILIDRYAQHLNRKHFEQLLCGSLKPISHSKLIYPDKLAYVHFQLLTVFTEYREKYSHYIDHESAMRSAVLMSVVDDIKEKQVDVSFFVPLKSSNEVLKAKAIGWWKDKWFSNEQGAYCPILSQKEETNFPFFNTCGVEDYYRYLDKYLYKGVNSHRVIDNVSEIYRVIFNYCELKNGKTTAQRLLIDEKAYTSKSLLEEALAVITSE